MAEPKVNKKELRYQDEIMIEGNLLTKKEVSKILRISTTSIDRLVRKGELKVKKLGTGLYARCYYFKSDVLNLLGISE